MQSDINKLSESILTLDEVSCDYDAETVSRLKEIAQWGIAYVNSFLFEGVSFQYATSRLSIELMNNHPDLAKNTIDNILIYVHFYICR